MNENTATKILLEINDNIFGDNNRLYSINPYISYPAWDKTVCLDDDRFTAEQLEAIAWWMKNKKASSL